MLWEKDFLCQYKLTNWNIVEVTKKNIQKTKFLTEEKVQTEAENWR